MNYPNFLGARTATRTYWSKAVSATGPMGIQASAAPQAARGVVTRLIGAVLPTSTLFFFALILLVLVCLQFSVRITKLDDQVKKLAQALALKEAKGQKQKQDR